jgi:hypothetical protein
MPFVPTVLPALDALRAIGGKLGLRVFTCTVRRRVWSGSRPGLPGTTKVDTDTLLTCQAADGTLQPASVRQLTRKEVFASGGLYSSRDLKVGPITPSFAAGLFLPGAGFTDATINAPPPATNVAKQIIWLLNTNDGQTHGIPDGGLVAELKGQESTALHFFVILDAMGRVVT